MMKVKTLSLLICTLFLAGIIPASTCAQNPISSVANSYDSLTNDPNLIKIADAFESCDIDDDYVVFANGSLLQIYNIKTGTLTAVDLGGDIVFPKISDHKVLYFDFHYMGFKMYDIETGEKTEITITNWEGGDSDAFQFYGDYIVYENFNQDMYSTEIYLYNMATGLTLQLTDCPDMDYAENPCIYKNHVVWQRWEGNVNDIFMYDIESQEYTRITNTSEFASETFPSIYENILSYSYFYYDKVNGTQLYALKTYDVSSGVETTILTGENATGTTPEIYGSIIAYSQVGVSLNLYDLTTHTDTAIYEGTWLSYPWNLNGYYIAFTIVDDGIYLYKYNELPVIEIENITGGLFKVSAVIKNTGDVPISGVDWSLLLDGGLIILGRESSGTIATIEPGATAEISSKVIFGFGKTALNVRVGTEAKSQNATVFFVFIKT
jgi:hypothetical protein